MKLINFKGSKINEYIDVDLNFKDDLSIIVGTNGSGKTTSLNLIQALLLPKLSEIIITPFDHILLTFEANKNNYVLVVTKDRNEVIFSVHNEGSPHPLIQMKFDRNLITEFDLYKHSKNDINVNEFLLKKYREDPYIKFINDLQKPSFIGLERTTVDVKEDYKDYLFERKYYFRKNESIKNELNQYKENLGVSILETELLIQSIYNRLKLVQDRFFKSIQKELINSSFDFIEFDPSDIPSKVNIREKQHLLERQAEIEDSLKKIGILDGETQNRLKIFFEKIKKLFEDASREDEGYAIEWFLNKSQIDKMSKLVNSLDAYKLRMDETFLPVTKFINVINSFFKDTGKKVTVDQVGRLLIQKPQGRPLTVDELSSGERQLIILFANVIFNKYKSKSNVTKILIIDEPEISLHIRWQEKFIQSLIDASTNTQFVIATHSPDIIGDYKFNAIKISNKYVGEKR